MALTRDQLLSAAVDYVSAEGVGGFSMRACAEALGTSHRMLSYHFGSRDGLLRAIAQEWAARTRAAVQQLVAAQRTMTRTGLEAMLTRLMSDPAMVNGQRLLVESMYLRIHDPAYGTFEEVLEAWSPLYLELVRRADPHETDERRLRSRARLAFAVGMGLAIDVTATGDLEAVGDAYREWFALALGPG